MVATSSSNERFCGISIMDEDCVLEKEPLVKLARDRELSIWKHRGFWYAMDTQRDREHLNELWNSGKAPWKVP